LHYPFFLNVKILSSNVKESSKLKVQNESEILF